MQTARAAIGHNSRSTRIAVEVKLFNSLSRHGNGKPFHALALSAGATVGDVVRHFAIPADSVYLVLVNGRDVTRTLGDGVNLDRELDDGDVVALSGPVPFSWGYGAAVV
ncbi:MoaD/ThiS family protein [Azospirillum halopraeferens]|uniref:MoaD/ThiS family protein n=1 Tax=Azospirillum halopraeferens TaxID=34010 RepID=UPI00042A1A8E|nr:MoaD/ThiS family protein [Azospirillum halopraeferens]